MWLFARGVFFVLKSFLFQRQKTLVSHQLSIELAYGYDERGARGLAA